MSRAFSRSATRRMIWSALGCGVLLEKRLRCGNCGTGVGMRISPSVLCVPDDDGGGEHLPVMRKGRQCMLASRIRTVRAQVNGHAFPGVWIGHALRIRGQLIAVPVLQISRFDVDQIFGRADGTGAVEHAAVAREWL